MIIEKNIPIPPSISEVRSKRLYGASTWKLMDVGDSVFVPNETSQCLTMRSAQKWSQRQFPMRYFRSAKEGNGVRIFRIK